MQAAQRAPELRMLSLNRMPAGRPFLEPWCCGDVLEVEQLGVVEIEVLDATARSKAAFLEQTLSRQVGLVGRDIQFRLRAAALQLGEQCSRDSAPPAAGADHKRRNEALVEERVIQYREAQDFVTLGGDDALAVPQRRCDPLCPVRVRADQRVDEAQAWDVRNAGGTKHEGRGLTHTRAAAAAILPRTP